MTIATTIAVFSIAALFVLFFLGRRMLRLAIKLALAGLLVLILIAGGIFWWWSYSGNSSEQNPSRPAASPARRAPSR